MTSLTVMANSKTDLSKIKAEVFKKNSYKSIQVTQRPQDKLKNEFKEGTNSLLN